MFKADRGSAETRPGEFSFGQWAGLGLCTFLCFLGLAALLYASAPVCRAPFSHSLPIAAPR